MSKRYAILVSILLVSVLIGIYIIGIYFTLDEFLKTQYTIKINETKDLQLYAVFQFSLQPNADTTRPVYKTKPPPNGYVLIFHVAYVNNKLTYYPGDKFPVTINYAGALTEIDIWDPVRYDYGESISPTDPVYYYQFVKSLTGFNIKVYDAPTSYGTLTIADGFPGKILKTYTLSKATYDITAIPSINDYTTNMIQVKDTKGNIIKLPPTMSTYFPVSK